MIVSRIDSEAQVKALAISATDEVAQPETGGTNSVLPTQRSMAPPDSPAGGPVPACG